MLRSGLMWFDWLFDYPPRQQRPPRQRALPARVHRLEVFFSVDGEVERYRYRPEIGITFVPVPS